MAEHKFGGDWTSEKLERVRKYLCAYTKIFAVNPKAQFLSTTYVDGFAGMGLRVDSAAPHASVGFFGDQSDKDAESFKKGSARIALEVEPTFDHFIFIEREPSRVKELKALRREFPAKTERVQIECAEANDFLQRWCAVTDWRQHRAVVFLDPYGMQVAWTTVEALAKTKAVDLWMLFPLGIAVNRLLPKAAPPPDEWAQALTRIFGTREWQQEFYQKKRPKTLFEDDDRMQKSVCPDAIGSFFVRRLKTVFTKVANNPLSLSNSMNTPIYLLCFAAGNPKGAPTAVEIAQHILKP